MGFSRVVAFRIAAVGTVAFLPLDAQAQERAGPSEGKRKDSVSTVVAGKYYGANGFKQTLLGSGWRDVWVTPISVPSLEISKFNGGLKLLERGGGYQTITLHLQEENVRKE